MINSHHPTGSAWKALRRPLGVYAAVSALILLIEKTGFYPYIIVPFLLLYLPFFLIRNEKKNLRHFGLEIGDWRVSDLVSALKASVAVFIPYIIFCLVFIGNSPLAGFDSPGKILSLVFSEIFLVGLPEEVFFRGYLQTSLEDVFLKRFRFLGVTFGLGLILTAAFFSLNHLLLTGRLFSLAVFFPALVFGWLKERTGKIPAPAIFHALANIVYVFIPWWS
jgi:membrane protease YdiL (CAAX protease family)